MIKFLLESFNLLSEAMFIATQQTFHADLKQTLVSIFLLKLCSLQRCKEQSGNHCRLRSFNLLVEAMFIATITAHPDLQMQISQSFNLLVEAMFIATPKRPIFGKRRRSRVSIFLLKLCSLQHERIEIYKSYNYSVSIFCVKLCSLLQGYACFGEIEELTGFNLLVEATFIAT